MLSDLKAVKITIDFIDFYLKRSYNFGRRRKENLIRVRGGKCLLCGYDKSNSALEFHHIDAAQKLYSIAARSKYRRMAPPQTCNTQRKHCA